MHLEVFNPSTGETQTDSAPIVVGLEINEKIFYNITFNVIDFPTN